MAVANGPTETADPNGDLEASLQAVEAASQCPPCPGVLDASIMGEDDELMAMSSKAFACNVQVRGVGGLGVQSLGLKV